MKLVELCQAAFPHLHITGACGDVLEAHELLQAGVKLFSRRDVLQCAGAGP